MEGILQQENNKSESPKNAMEKVLRNIDVTKVPDTFEIRGREYPVTGEIDILVARAQSRREQIEVMYKEVVGIDYRKEEALVKLRAYMDSFIDFLIRYAELVTKYPDLADDISSLTLAANEMMKYAEETWQDFKKKMN